MTTQDLFIRPARIQDLDTLTRFSAAMALETERRTLDPLRLRQGTLTVLEEPHHGSFYVAELRSDHLVVGQLLITYEWSDWRNAQFWWIQSVYVDPGWRRQGVYRACTRPSLLQRTREQMSAAFVCTWNRRMLWPSQFIRP